ncbi:hypothetical protein D9X91_12275 [Falsibacillus albus]|uniref:Uncharacterized protein n=2 Tax=Falsibacillus albus TaxID=2478915 RepID=A0A3L7JWR9_9BACI|nr:hypothetical protein D9X91_12275 [Falsibacillus albus]
MLQFNIMTGHANGTFSLYENTDRAQMAKIIAQFLEFWNTCRHLLDGRYLFMIESIKIKKQMEIF